MFAKLNGWRRLLVVVSLFWLVPVTAFVVDAWPTRSEITRDWLNAYIEEVIARSAELHEAAASTIRAAYGDLSDEEVLKKLEEKYSSTVPLELIELKHYERIAALPTNRAKLISLGAFVWFLPMLIAYLVGLAFAWVRAGFVGTGEGDA